MKNVITLLEGIRDHTLTKARLTEADGQHSEAQDAYKYVNELESAIASLAAKPLDKEDVRKLAGILYDDYCEAVGGKAFNGDPLPCWEDFESDPNKSVQSNAWKKVAVTAINALK